MEINDNNEEKIKATGMETNFQSVSFNISNKKNILPLLLIQKDTIKTIPPDNIQLINKYNVWILCSIYIKLTAKIH